MADENKAEQGGATAERSEQGCAVKMHDGGPCGRPIHTAGAGFSDTEPKCLMHSGDPNKSNAQFQFEFDRMLQCAGKGDADFTRFVFNECDLKGREFKARCIFSHAHFKDFACLAQARFAGDADFTAAFFEGGASFGDARFEGTARFVGAYFKELAWFFYTNFSGDAEFGGAVFEEKASFEGAKFQARAEFLGASFHESADFTRAVFTLLTDFQKARFRGPAIFRETLFPADPNNAESVGPVFTLAEFDKPEAVIFGKTYLGRALFHNCDVSRFNFSEAEWAERENGKRIVFEEAVDLKLSAARALVPEFVGWATHDRRNYQLIAELYQQLKKNYDDRRDYWTAGDWHYGEMEMKRLSSPRRNRMLRWLHRKLGLVAWYKYVSEYGENYVLPGLWLLVVFLALSLVYPVAGLSRSGGSSGIGQRRSTKAVASVPLMEAYSGPNVMTAVGIAFFQRDLPYQPTWPWGRLLSWFQLLVTYTLVALFLLALRRQFRR
jgi:uncharacterized protein YjbI with pentapeptide repeats